MEIQKLRTKRRLRRKKHVRKKIWGTREIPRMSVSRSCQHIYVQLIDDLAGRTLCQASTRSKDLRDAIAYGGNKEAAAKVGAELAEKAKRCGVRKVRFDRNGFAYHGRVQALADAAREGGLEF